MILAGDIGATRARLGLFDHRGGRPREREVREFATTDFDRLTAIVETFLRERSMDDGSVTAAAFGVAGPVLGSTARLTNVAFEIDAPDVARRAGIPHVQLLNDVEAMAYSLPALEGDEVHVLQEGTARRTGSLGLVAAGTGLGEAMLHPSPAGYVAHASEAGHADWAPRTERDIRVLRTLVARHGRAEVEHVVSGTGLRNLYVATHTASCPAGVDADAPDAPAAITSAALAGRCPACVEALDIFVEAYGAEAGNLALRSLALGGVYVGGGIAPRILPAMTDGRFMQAFRDKGPMRELVEQVPVKIVLNAEAGLLGSAVFAAGLDRGSR